MLFTETLPEWLLKDDLVAIPKALEMLDGLPSWLRSNEEPPPQWLLAEDGAVPRRLIKFLLARKFFLTNTIHIQIVPNSS